MRKAVLEGNILPKAKQLFLVDGFPSAQIIDVTRDTIEMTLGVIELPDQTKVPGGRRRAGEFTKTFQFARDIDRETYYRWFMMSVDKGDSGIDPTYKRNCTIIMQRLFQGSPGTYNSGSDVPPVRVKLFGCWISRMTLGDMDINADEGDGDVMSEITCNYDDVELEGSNNILQAAQNLLR